MEVSVQNDKGFEIRPDLAQEIEALSSSLDIPTDTKIIFADLTDSTFLEAGTILFPKSLCFKIMNQAERNAYIARHLKNYEYSLHEQEPISLDNYFKSAMYIAISCVPLAKFTDNNNFIGAALGIVVCAIVYAGSMQRKEEVSKLFEFDEFTLRLTRDPQALITSIIKENEYSRYETYIFRRRMNIESLCTEMGISLKSDIAR